VAAQAWRIGATRYALRPWVRGWLEEHRPTRVRAVRVLAGREQAVLLTVCAMAAAWAWPAGLLCVLGRVL